MAKLSDKTTRLMKVMSELLAERFRLDLPDFLEELGGEKAVLRRMAGMGLDFNFTLLVTERPVPGQETVDGLPPMHVLIEVEKEVFE